MRLPVMISQRGIHLPGKAYPGDAGFDLQAAHDATIEPGDRCVVGTATHVEIPRGHVGLILPRSGQAAYYGITHLDAPGVIDSEYRGELHFILFNSDKSARFEVRAGDHLGQLVVLALADVDPVLVDVLAPSQRGSRGLGSSR
jgi:dUTP pyrophosphatase